VVADRLEGRGQAGENIKLTVDDGRQASVAHFGCGQHLAAIDVVYALMPKADPEQRQLAVFDK
jgi:hypothetical protein